MSLNQLKLNIHVVEFLGFSMKKTVYSAHSKNLHNPSIAQCNVESFLCRAIDSTKLESKVAYNISMCKVGIQDMSLQIVTLSLISKDCCMVVVSIKGKSVHCFCNCTLF